MRPYRPGERPREVAEREQTQPQASSRASALNRRVEADAAVLVLPSVRAKSQSRSRRCRTRAAERPREVAESRQTLPRATADGQREVTEPAQTLAHTSNRASARSRGAEADVAAREQPSDRAKLRGRIRRGRTRVAERSREVIESKQTHPHARSRASARSRRTEADAVASRSGVAARSHKAESDAAACERPSVRAESQS